MAISYPHLSALATLPLIAALASSPAVGADSVSYFPTRDFVKEADGYFCDSLFAGGKEADDRLFSAYVQALEAYRVEVAASPFYAALESFLNKKEFYDLSRSEKGAHPSVVLLAKIGDATRDRRTSFDSRIEAHLRDLIRVAKEEARTVEKSVEKTENVKRYSKELNRWGANSISTDQEFRYAVAAPLGRSFQIWDLKTASLIKEIQTPALTYAAEANRDFTRILTADNSMSLRLWDAKTGVQLRTFDHAASEANRLIVHPDFKRAISIHSSNKMILWNLETGEKLVLEGHHGPIYALKMNAEWTRAISTSMNGEVIVWDLETGASSTYVLHTKDTVALATNREFTRAITGSHDRSLTIWNTSTGVVEHEALGIGYTPLRIVANSAFTRALISTAEGDLLLWDLENHVRLDIFKGHVGTVYSLEASPDWKRAMSFGEDGKLIEWDLDRHTAVDTLIVAKKAGGGARFALSPDWNEVLTGSSTGGGSGSLMLWDRVAHAQAE